MHSSHFTSSNTTKENNIYCYITWSTTSPNHSPRTQQKRHKVVLVVQRIKSVIARDIIKGLSLQGQGQGHNFVLKDNQGTKAKDNIPAYSVFTYKNIASENRRKTVSASDRQQN